MLYLSLHATLPFFLYFYNYFETSVLDGMEEEWRYMLGYYCLLLKVLLIYHFLFI